MSSRLFLTDSFYKELDNIYEYSVTEWGEQIADEYLEEVNNALQLIKENSEVLTIREEISPHFQTYLANKHWLICHVKDQFVIVLTILHTSRNVIDRLDELEPTLKNEIEVLGKRLNSSLGSE